MFKYSFTTDDDKETTLLLTVLAFAARLMSCSSLYLEAIWRLYRFWAYVDKPFRLRVSLNSGSNELVWDKILA